MSALSGYTTLLDIAKANGSDALIGIIDETTKATPEVRLGNVRPMKGISYKARVRTALPATGFRIANQGSAVTKSTYTTRVVECYVLNPRWEVDQAVADTYEFGAPAYIAEEACAITESSMQTLGIQFFYGANQWTVSSTSYGGSAGGFPGLVDIYNGATYTLDAGGSTANTASSVWGVKWGDRNCSWVYGNNGQLAMSDVMLQRVTDSNNNPFDAYCQHMMARPGLALGDNRSVCRVKNITADSGHTLTDAMLFNVIALLPANIMPDMWFMTRRSVTQLRNSRTATNPTGKEAPIPTDVGGIPIHVTDSITNVEPINFLGI